MSCAWFDVRVVRRRVRFGCLFDCNAPVTEYGWDPATEYGSALTSNLARALFEDRTDNSTIQQYSATFLVSRARATKGLSKSLQEALREGSSATLGSSRKVPEHPKTTRPEEEDR